MGGLPAELKPLAPYLKRAEELDKDSRPESQVVAYYCRQYAMELGISLQDQIEDKAAGQQFLLSLIERLEKDKPPITKEEGEQTVFAFALDVFARADNEDRTTGSGKNTARTFYAASVFFDALKQFGDRGLDADEKCRYAKWKAADIINALKEGRQPAKGGPGEEEADDDDDQQQHEYHNDMPEIPEAPQAPTVVKEIPSVPPPYTEVIPPVQHQPPNSPPAQAQPANSPPPPQAQPRAAVPQVPAAPPPFIGKSTSGEISQHQIDDALEYAKFAVAALEVKDTNLAVERLRGALGVLQ